jgi:predicted AAA+ superfamily ATPase
MPSEPTTVWVGPPIPPELELSLRRMNPWWSGSRPPRLPSHRRHLVGQIRRRLEANLAPIVAVRGARQIGKTTSQLQVLRDLLQEGLAPTHVLRIQFDELAGLEEVGMDPIILIVDWYERTILGKTLNQAAHDGERTVLFFDEVQNLNKWAPQLKSLVDHSTTQVVVTGSSALRIALGHDSLAGRLTTIEAGTLSLTEIAALRGISLSDPFLADNGLGPLKRIEFWNDLGAHGRKHADARDVAFEHFSALGGYPIGHARPNVEWGQIADQLNENVIRRVIQHDLRVGERGRLRDFTLLEEVFRLVCRYAGQCPSVPKLAEDARLTLQGLKGRAFLRDERVRSYVRFLADSLVVRTIEPLELQLKRIRGTPKLCLVDHALRASWLQEVVPLTARGLAEQPALATLAGHLAESTVGAVLSTIIGLDIAYLPEHANTPELDFVLTVGMQRIPIEVKYQNVVDPLRDAKGLLDFIAQPGNRASFGLLVTRRDVELPGLDPRIVALPLSSLMLLR